MKANDLLKDIIVRNNNTITFKQVCDTITDIHEKKNTDYGDSFTKTMDKYGEIAAAIRLNDKLNRFEQLIKNDASVLDESKEDTLLDLAAYAIMTYMWIKNKA